MACAIFSTTGWMGSGSGKCRVMCKNKYITRKYITYLSLLWNGICASLNSHL